MNLTSSLADRPAAGPRRSQAPRALLVRALLACLCGTAALGIFALLTGSFDETGARVLGSTWLVGLYCMLCLAAVTVLDTRHRAVGVAGIVAATAAAALGLIPLWVLGENWNEDLVFVLRAFWLSGVVAVALAHAALLLRIDLCNVGPVTAVRAATLTTMTLVAMMLGAPAVDFAIADTGGYWRLVGALLILDVLGSVTVPVLARSEARSAR